MSVAFHRDIYKAMVMDMDSAVTTIVDKLKALDLYNNTIIVFTTDNGGAISHGASNWPLRGTKGTMFEGGTRAVSFVHAPHLMNRTGYVNRRLVHITDWMPTLLRYLLHFVQRLKIEEKDFKIFLSARFFFKDLRLG